MSMAMALNNVKKCYSKVPNSCLRAMAALWVLTQWGRNHFQISISQNIFHYILVFVELTCILLGILTSKKMPPTFVLSFLLKIPNKNP